MQAHYLQPGERVYFYQKRAGETVEKIVGVVALDFAQATTYLFDLGDGADYWPLSAAHERQLFETNERRYPDSYKHYLRANPRAESAGH